MTEAPTTRASLFQGPGVRLPPLTLVVRTLATVGGAERATALIANGLAARGHQVSVVTLWGQGSQFPLDPAVRLHALRNTEGGFRQSYLADTLQLRAHLVRHRPGILIGAEISTMLLALPAAAGLRIACVGWEHFNFKVAFNRPRGRLNRWHLARRLTARFAHAVVTLTQRDADFWRAGLPNLRARAEVIANPLPFMQAPSAPYDVRNRVVLAAGRLTRQKGFDLLLAAWQQLERDFPDWTLRIVGGDGEEEANLKAQALHTALQRVAFVGKVRDMRAEYAAAGLYCLSSRYEGLPLVLLECQSHGVPVVAFDCETGPREIIQQGENGVLVPPEDVGALVAALRATMSDPERRAAMSQRSCAAADRFDPEEILTKWESLLGQLGTRPAVLVGAARR